MNTKLGCVSILNQCKHLFGQAFAGIRSLAASQPHLSARRLGARDANMHGILKTKIFVIHSNVNFFSFKLG